MSYSISTLVAAWLSAFPEQRKIDIVVDPEGKRPTGLRDFMGTEDSNGKSADTIEKRLKRCYELTAFALVFGTAPDNARLVHGSIHGPEDDMQRISHAWLLLRTGEQELVWEPATFCWHLRGDWYNYSRAWEEREYTYSTARDLIRSYDNYGPWHNSRYP